MDVLQQLGTRQGDLGVAQPRPHGQQCLLYLCPAPGVDPVGDPVVFWSPRENVHDCLDGIALVLLNLGLEFSTPRSSCTAPYESKKHSDKGFCFTKGSFPFILYALPPPVP